MGGTNMLDDSARKSGSIQHVLNNSGGIGGYDIVALIPSVIPSVLVVYNVKYNICQAVS